MIYLAFVIVFLLGILLGWQAAKRRYNQRNDGDLFELWRESWSIP